MSLFAQWLWRAFPVPRYLLMQATAVDISPNSIKVLTGTFTDKGCLPLVFDEIFLPPGAIERGVIHDTATIIAALSELKGRHSMEYVAVSIPEDALYLYTLEIAGPLEHKAVLQQIEFTFSEHVPFGIESAIYDFDVVERYSGGGVVSVTVAPQETIQTYESLLTQAGLQPTVLELEAHAIARSVCCACRDVEMVVDIGHARTAVILTKHSVPIFTATIDAGVDGMDEVVTGCKRHFTFWDTRSDTQGRRVERVARVILCGGGATEPFAQALRQAISAEVLITDVWQHLFSTHEYIPSILQEDSKSMATLAGLLLSNKA